MNRNDLSVNIVGAGLAGLSAAITLARRGISSRLISVQPSQRAQSNLAEGGINAVMDVMGENDTLGDHFRDTMEGGVYLADPNMVRNLVNKAPDIVRELSRIGVPFERKDGRLIQRAFGGQNHRRTAFVKSTTGKALTVALIDEARKYEAAGYIDRYSHHCFTRLLIRDGKCAGVQLKDIYSGQDIALPGDVVMSTGGLNGLFNGNTTGTTANTGLAAAMLLSQKVELANLEFIQYHPTTMNIKDKRLLISEAARGEGGRLFALNDDGSRYYFMEDKYGERGNLMPRDVVSREMIFTGRDVYLDMTGIDSAVLKGRLSDLCEEIEHYFGIDASKEPIPVSPGIHYFMGGILVDEGHHTNIPNLYAAGECACAYHGANRLGGNSLLGAIFGGLTAAQSLAEDMAGLPDDRFDINADEYIRPVSGLSDDEKDIADSVRDILFKAMGIARDEDTLKMCLSRIETMDISGGSDELSGIFNLSRAVIKCAMERKESRGAHYRTDYPDTLDEYRKITVCRQDNGDISISFRDIPALKEDKNDK